MYVLRLDGIGPDESCEIGQVATSTARKCSAPEGRVAPAFQLPLARLQDHTRIFFSFCVKSTCTLSRMNPAKLIAVLAAVACRCLRELADRIRHQTQHGGRCRLPSDVLASIRRSSL